MVCPACGKEYDAGASFCGIDGSKLQPLEKTGGGVCENCGREYEEPFDYCPHDGGRILRVQAPDSQSSPAAGSPSSSTYSPSPEASGAQGAWSVPQPTSAPGWRIQASIAEVLSRGWALFTADFLKYIGISLLAAVPSLIPPLEGFWNLFLFLVPLPEGIMMGYALKRAHGVEPQFGDVDRVFSMLVPLALVRIVSFALTTVGFLLLIIPGIYLATSYMLALPLVLDRGLGFWEALETSRQVVSQRWFIVFGLALIMILIVAIAIVTVVGSLFALPFSCCVVIALYEAALGIAGGARKPQEA